MNLLYHSKAGVWGDERIREMNTEVAEIKVGDTVIWRDGDKRKVTALSPDGRLFQAEGLKGLRPLTDVRLAPPRLIVPD
jgi:hypothetical protein